MKKLTGLLVVLPISLAMGCKGSEENEDTTTSDETGDTGGTSMTTMTTMSTSNTTTMSTTGDTGTVDDTTTTGPPPECADPNDPNAPRVTVDADISGDEMWTCDNIYVLADLILVNGGTLTIEAGTTIQGMGGSALVIDQDAAINAAGTDAAPIVFTSILPEGERNRGDWGGLVLIGDAVVNLDGGVGIAEGFADPPMYGGEDAAHDCGTLQYVRVEWAGYAISEGSELNGITFYACGTGTTVDHVQSHMGSDDGIEMFGGAFDAKYVVVTGASDDSIDCDQGFRGRLQHVFIHQDPAESDNALEWSNQATGFTDEPLTGPTLVNATIVGGGAGGTGGSKGMTLKEGTEAFIYSSIITNVTNELVQLTHPETQANAEGGGIELGGVIVDAGGAFVVGDGTSWTDMDLQDWVLGQVTEADAMLPSIDWTSPNIAPAAGTPAEGAGATPGDAWFDQTTYAGAVEPGGTDWTQEGWINYGV